MRSVNASVIMVSRFNPCEILKSNVTGCTRKAIALSQSRTKSSRSDGAFADVIVILHVSSAGVACPKSCKMGLKQGIGAVIPMSLHLCACGIRAESILEMFRTSLAELPRYRKTIEVG